MGLKLFQIICNHAEASFDEKGISLTCDNKECQKYKKNCFASAVYNTKTSHKYNVNLSKMVQCKYNTE